jgi:hypothetical protein
MNDEANIVWENTVDQGAWAVKVERTEEPYRGILTIVRTSDGKEVHREDVGLSYDAIFGPDVADVADWEDRCIAVIDAQE